MRNHALRVKAPPSGRSGEYGDCRFFSGIVGTPSSQLRPKPANGGAAVYSEPFAVVLTFMYRRFERSRLFTPGHMIPISDFPKMLSVAVN